MARLLFAGTGDLGSGRRAYRDGCSSALGIGLSLDLLRLFPIGEPTPNSRRLVLRRRPGDVSISGGPLSLEVAALDVFPLQTLANEFEA